MRKRCLGLNCIVFCLVSDGSTIGYDILMRELWLRVGETRAALPQNLFEAASSDHEATLYP